MAKDEAQTFNVLDNPLKCPICGHDKFFRRGASIDLPPLTFGLDREAETLTCEKCSHVLWFEIS